MDDIFNQIDKIVANCERLATDLALLAPNHYLVKFDLSDASDSEREECIRRFWMIFGPPQMNRTKPTTLDSLLAFLKYETLLEQAYSKELARLCLSLAQSGLYAPKREDSP